MAGNVFYVAAKNLFTRKMSVYDHRLFHNIYDDDTYSKFHPQAVDDFKVKTHYGQIIGRDMIYIVDMGVDKEEMEARLHDKGHPQRIRNLNRLSHSLTKRPLKELKPAEEIQEATATKNSSRKKTIQAARRMNDERQLKKFMNKGKMVSSTPLVTSDRRQSRQGASSTNVSPTPVQNTFHCTDMETDNIPKPDAKDKSEQIPDKEVPCCSSAKAGTSNPQYSQK